MLGRPEQRRRRARARWFSLAARTLWFKRTQVGQSPKKLLCPNPTGKSVAHFVAQIKAGKLIQGFPGASQPSAGGSAPRLAQLFASRRLCRPVLTVYDPLSRKFEARRLPGGRLG